MAAKERRRDVVKERLVLGDLVRTNLSRHEDARLLKRLIARGPPGDDRRDVARRRLLAVGEVEVRERWRVAREEQILARVDHLGLVSCADGRSVSSQEQLAQRVDAFNALVRDERRRQRQRTLKSPYAFDGGAGATTSGRRPNSARSGRRAGPASRPGTAPMARPLRPASAAPAGGAASRPHTAAGDGDGTTESRLMRITRELLRGLEHHVQADGPAHAIGALRGNVQEAQDQLASLVRSAREKCAQDSGGSAAANSGNGDTSSATSASSEDLRVHLTKLGYFGSTQADLAVAEHQRRGRAARTIQKVARGFIAVRRAIAAARRRREEEEARKQARRDSCARRIQAPARTALRRWAGRRERIASIARTIAARKIQRAFRYGRLIAAFRKQSNKSVGLSAAVQGGRMRQGGPWGAATTIQAHFRGHRARRLLAMASPRARAHARRHLRGLWGRHVSAMKDSLPLHRSLMGVFCAFERELAKARR